MIKKRYQKFIIDARTGDPNFLYFVVMVKYGFFILSSILFFIYLSAYVQIKEGVRVFEQKAIYHLSLLLIGYNDPFYPITLFFPNLLSVVVSTTLTMAFYSYLLYFWLVYFHRIYKENNFKNCRTEHYWKKVICLIIFIGGSLGYSIQSYVYVNDPGYQVADYYMPAYEFFIWIIDPAAIGIMGIIVIFGIKIWREWPVLIQRHKVSCQFSSYFISVIMLFFFTGNIHIYYENGTKAL